ncbi:MAG: hypothetical protein GC189_09940 [Alphaproteobacteria bacterium]|nr:hypothetical protein [Alphaproteobacteria bacterium]
MPREVDKRRTRKAQRALERLKRVQEDGGTAEDFSGWETEFLSEVGARLDKYGSAFADLSKGAPEDALSRLQAVKLKEIEAKAKGKPRKGLQTRKPLGWKKRAKPGEDGGEA